MFESLKNTLLAMAGDKNAITINRSFVEFTGSLEAGMMLSQLLYWTPRTQRPDGFIFKTDQDWMDELCLSRYAVRKARETLERLGILTTKLEKARGAPTTHYRLDLSRLVELWADWVDSTARLSEIEQSIVRNQTNSLSEIGQSITETTIDQDRDGDFSDLFPAHDGDVRPEHAPAERHRQGVIDALMEYENVQEAVKAAIEKVTRQNVQWRWKNNQAMLTRLLEDYHPSARDIFDFQEWWNSDEWRRENTPFPSFEKMVIEWPRMLDWRHGGKGRTHVTDQPGKRTVIVG